LVNACGINEFLKQEVFVQSEGYVFFSVLCGWGSLYIFNSSQTLIPDYLWNNC